MLPAAKIEADGWLIAEGMADSSGKPTAPSARRGEDLQRIAAADAGKDKMLIAPFTNIEIFDF